MIEVTEEVLADMVRVIVDEVSPERIVLFGSRGRGDEGSDADVDLLVIKSEPFGTGRSRLEEMGALWRALARFEIPKDILIYTREEVERRRGWVNHIVSRALQEGRLLYEKT